MGRTYYVVVRHALFMNITYLYVTHTHTHCIIQFTTPFENFPDESFRMTSIRNDFIPVAFVHCLLNNRAAQESGCGR